MKIMFSAGETSGDIHGAALAKEILRLAKGTELIGFGGNEMEKAGVRLVKNFAGFNFMGVIAVIAHLPQIFRLLNELVAAMEEEKPDLLVIIDYPDFNWRLAKRAKERGIPVFSYIPPSAWAWRKGRAKSCAKIADVIAAIFPFELPVYKAAGANIKFFGNPLVDAVKPDLNAEETREFFALPQDKHIVLLLPGSRKHEIDLLLPPMLEAAKTIYEMRPDTVFYLPVADGVDEDNIAAHTDKAALPFVVTRTHEHRYDLMAASDVALATSGTVVMEAALLGLPCVVLYKVAAVTYFALHNFISVKYFSLPNILLDEGLLTELLQDDVTTEKILAAVLPLYRGEKTREKVLAGLRESVARLGEPGAAARTADAILKAAAGEF